MVTPVDLKSGMLRVTISLNQNAEAECPFVTLESHMKSVTAIPLVLASTAAVADAGGTDRNGCRWSRHRQTA